MTLQNVVRGPHLLPPGQGEHWHFLGSLMTVKVDSEQSEGALTAIEFAGERGWGPPLHRHDVEDELFFMLEGTVRFWCEGAEATHGAGASVWLPRGLSHQFQVVSDTARFFQVTTPGQFDRFVQALGDRVDEPVLPGPPDVDPARVAQVCADFQIEVLGPPPAPLD